MPRLSFSFATPCASVWDAMDVKNKVCINFVASKDFSMTRDFIAGADAGEEGNEALNYSV